VAISRGSKVFLVVIAIAVGVVFGALSWVNWLLGGDPGPGDPVVVEVTAGATAGSIGELLADEGVVRSALAFRLVARSRGLDANLQAGDFELETGMSVDEVIDALLDGPPQRPTYRFTVEEGLTVAQTLDRLAAQTPHTVADYQGLLDARLAADADGPGLLDLPDWVPALSSFGPEVRQPFEGMFFPETYEMFADASALAVLQRMLDQLTVVTDGLPPDADATFADRGLTRYQAFVIASLIERETRVEAERVVVSGVIANRLGRGMLLQLDATCLYAIGGHKERVLQEDCEVDSPYNTYVTAGLPPTPISGVGKASILAALEPADVTFLYYVVAPECDGTHRFAASLDEHNRNVAALREAGGCR